MRIIKYSIITILLFVHNILLIQAQNTEGKDFWLTFGHTFSYSWNWIDIQIRIVCGDKPANGSITFTKLGTSVNFNLNSYEIFTYNLDDTQKEAVRNQTMGITNHSVFINASEKLTVYAFSNMNYIAEATCVLPVTALGREYYQISYKESMAYSDSYAVVATQNNTTVYHNGTPVATINTGQVYCRTSTDMTGAFITSNNPVAFFATHQRACIPDEGKMSNLYEQLPPVNTWGRTFFVPVSAFEQEIIRIIVSQNGTYITQTGGTIRIGVPGAQTTLSNLQAGQFVELDINLINNGCFIHSNNPVGVCSYMTRFGTPTLASQPSQCWIPGIEQSVTKAVIAPFVANVLNSIAIHYALLITPTDTKDNTMISIGGAPPQPISGGIWHNNATAGRSFYSMPLIDLTKSYIFSNQEGIIIFGYGVGLQPYNSSYYYLAYSAMRDLQATFSANDISYQLLKEHDFCEGDVHFMAEIEGLHPTHPNRITWWINGTEYLPAKTLDNWNKYFSAGTYEIRMDVIFDNNETASKTGTLIIKSCSQSAAFFANNVLHSELKNTTFCNKNVNFRAEIEGLHPTDPERIRWYVDGIEETSALNQTQWSKTFENGSYEIKMVAKYDNGETATLTGTLKVQALWINIKNVRY